MNRNVVAYPLDAFAAPSACRLYPACPPAAYDNSAWIAPREALLVDSSAPLPS
jgi:hypothetical protein